MTPLQTGDTQAVVYHIPSVEEMSMYVANARGSNETGPAKAYDRPFVRFDVTALFEESPPVPSAD